MHQYVHCLITSSLSSILLWTNTTWHRSYMSPLCSCSHLQLGASVLCCKHTPKLLSVRYWHGYTMDDTDVGRQVFSTVSVYMIPGTAITKLFDPRCMLP